MLITLEISAPSKQALKLALQNFFQNQDLNIRLKHRPFVGYIALYREIQCEYFNLTPDIFQSLRIYFSRLFQEYTQNRWVFVSKLYRTYTFKITLESAFSMISDLSRKEKIWVSRRASIQGLPPFALRHIIEYDFSRNFSGFKFLLWGHCALGKNEEMVESAIMSGVLTQVNYQKPESPEDIVFLKHDNVEIHHGDLVASGRKRFPIETWNLFDGSIPTADLVNIGGESFAMSALPSSRAPLDEAICFGSSTNWFHFIFEVFPRYIHYGVENLAGKNLVIPTGTPIQIQELLIEISKKPLTELGPRESLACNRVVSCVDTRSMGGLDVNVRKEDLFAVRKYFTDQGFLSSTPPFRKILIKRGGSLFRYIRNFKQLEVLLESNGFEIVDPATLSVREQSLLFSESKVVVGQAGAAFTNMIFVPPICQVVELSDTPMGDTFWREFILCFAHSHKKFELNRGGFPGARNFSPRFEVNLVELARYCEAQQYWE